MKNLIIVICFFATFYNCLSQEGIEFCYEILPNPKENSLLNVKARIFNSTSSDIYFLSESCNELDSFVETVSEDIEVYSMINCNATFPEKKMVKANSEYTFNTMLKVKKVTSNIELILRFVQLKSTTKVKGKSVYNVLKEYEYSTLTINGQI